MRFWDASAIVPLLVTEDTSDALEALFQDERDVAVWWATDVECSSAIARLERMGHLGPSQTDQAFQRLQSLVPVWHVIDPAESVRVTARRLLRVHDLRAADALQLAAAILGSEGRPASLELVCLDERLVVAARREGFQVLDQSAL